MPQGGMPMPPDPSAVDPNAMGAMGAAALPPGPGAGPDPNFPSTDPAVAGQALQALLTQLGMADQADAQKLTDMQTQAKQPALQALQDALGAAAPADPNAGFAEGPVGPGYAAPAGPPAGPPGMMPPMMG